MDIAKTIDKKILKILPRLANRHGLIAGATGTGKTVTLQRLAEEFSREGVPVFMADLKGDLSGMAMSGTPTTKITERLKNLELEAPEWGPNPTIFWDILGVSGHPVKTTLTEMGPVLISRLMDLNPTQTSVMQILFKIADDSKLLLIDLKDIKSLMSFVQENLEKLKVTYGHISEASLGTIQRNLMTLEVQGAEFFFGEPALDIQDLMQTDSNGHGYINILMADKLLQTPILYSTMLLWLLSELFEDLPEVGDLDKPKLVFFFDEAHLLFKDAPRVLLEKIELMVRLIRSKGVGVYFVSQNPADVPEKVLGQLSHRFQHALKAFTPNDQKAVKVSAQTMRANPAFSTEEVITQLAVGEALISVLDEKGSPTIVERGFILPPHSRMGAITKEERAQVISSSPFFGLYEKKLDRESAYEQLARKIPIAEVPEDEETKKEGSALNGFLFGSTGPRGGKKEGLIEKAASSMGKELIRGLMGSLMGGTKRRR